MDILNIINFMDNATATSACDALRPIFGLVGWGMFFIKIAVPIILIIVGMIEMTKAVMSKKDDEIKAAQISLVKKSIAAVSVFLITTIVSLLMGTIIGNTDYKCGTSCLNSPWNCSINDEVQ